MFVFKTAVEIVVCEFSVTGFSSEKTDGFGEVTGGFTEPNFFWTKEKIKIISY